MQDSRLINKSAYYSQDAVVSDYERARYSGFGNWVLRSERSVLEALLERVSQDSGNIQKSSPPIALDSPCGTGMWIPTLKAAGYSVVAADQSEAMLELARQRQPDDYRKTSAESLPFEDASFDLLLMHRFVFHFKDPARFLEEASRVIRPGGHLIFDYCAWTPRAIPIAALQDLLGGQTFVHRSQEISALAALYGFEVRGTCFVFALPTYLYRWIPPVVATVLEKLFSLGPLRRLKSKRYALLKRCKP